MRGENVDPARGLFIKPHLGEQLAQPDRRENEVTGKTKLLKQSVYKERRVQARADRRIAEFFGPSFADSPTAERRKLLHVEMDVPLEELREQIRELESRKTGLVYNMGTIRSVRVFGRREQDETV